MCHFLPENRPHAMLKANKMSICLQTSLRSMQRDTDHRRSGSFSCPKCRLMEVCSQELYRNIPVNDEAEALKEDFGRAVTSPSSLGQWEDLQTTALHGPSKIGKGGFSFRRGQRGR